MRSLRVGGGGGVEVVLGSECVSDNARGCVREHMRACMSVRAARQGGSSVAAMLFLSCPIVPHFTELLPRCQCLVKQCSCCSGSVESHSV
eukprot:scaffold120719_cov24-Tisochrysis_lutea.AAC.1